MDALLASLGRLETVILGLSPWLLGLCFAMGVFSLGERQMPPLPGAVDPENPLTPAETPETLADLLASSPNTAQLPGYGQALGGPSANLTRPPLNPAELLANPERFSAYGTPENLADLANLADLSRLATDPSTHPLGCLCGCGAPPSPIPWPVRLFRYGFGQFLERYCPLILLGLLWFTLILPQRMVEEATLVSVSCGLLFTGLLTRAVIHRLRIWRLRRKWRRRYG